MLHSRYMKDVASRMTIHHRSSHSARIKHNVLVNEGSRIFRNCSEELARSEARNHFSYLMQRMQFAQYPEQVRKEVKESTVARYESMMEERSGITIPNPPGQQQPRQRTPEDGSRRKHGWYTRNGEYESVLFVEATPKSRYAKEVRRVVKRLKMPIKVVERAGATIKGILQRSNLFGMSDCQRYKCLLCC